jgi:hypothetical protein
MSKNIYKIKKYKHLDEQIEINNFKPLIFVIINNTIENDKDYYHHFLEVLNESSKMCTYVCIYVINIDNFDNVNNNLIPSKLDNDVLVKMLVDGKMYIHSYYNKNDFITNITITINNANESIKKIISDHFNNSKNDRPPEVSPVKEDKKIQSTVISDINDEVSVNEEEDNENLDSDIEKLREDYKKIMEEKKKALHEKEILLKTMNT